MVRTKNPPLVSIVVLNWNRYEDTVLCLQHIRKMTYPNIEVVIVDNGSVDGSKSKLRSEKGIIFVDNPTNRGFTGGHIDGLAVSHGEFILLLNNDALITPNYLEVALQHFDDERVAVVGGRAYVWDSTHSPFDTKAPYYGYQDINPYTGEGFFVQTDNDYPLEVNNVSGSSVLVRRSAITEVGYLYDPFFAYFEETDLFARMKRAGYKVIYDPSLHIWHKGGVSSNSYFQFHQLFKNRFIFAVRNFQTNYLWRFFYIYTRIGISSLVRQWQSNEQQVMRKAYAKAFLFAWLSLPRHLWGRAKLRHLLGPSQYNEMLQKEHRSVSFLVNLDLASDDQTLSVASRWLAVIKLHPLHEVVFVTANTALRSTVQELIGSTSLAKVALDRRQLKTDSRNIAWLSAKYPWLYTSDSLDPPAIEALEDRLAVAAHQGASLLQFAQNGGLGLCDTQVSARALLIRIGGFKEKAPTAYLYSYTQQSELIAVESLIDDLHVASKLLNIPRSTAYTESVEQAIALDNYTLSAPGFWDRLLSKHRHISQLTSVMRWLLSSRIQTRLKVARLRNLVLFTIALRRHALATELKHIHNEIIQTHRLGNLENHMRHIRTQQLSYSLQHPETVPVFIICRDRLSTLEQLLQRLEYLGLKNILFIDNDSTFPPLVKYYATTPYQTFLTGQNVGHKSPWESGFIKTLAPEGFYIVTDPDVIPVEDCPADAMRHFLALHKKYEHDQKVGFGLKIDDLPDHYVHKQSVITWEKQFWLNPLEPDVHEVPLDTTFALYKPFNYRYFLFPSIRTGGNYVARHLPWYVDNASIDAEEQYYRDRASGTVTTWTVESLAGTLQKELAKQPQQQEQEVEKVA